MEEPRGVRRGRAGRIAARTAPEPQVNPCPPGQRGGQYRPLSEAEMRAIYRTALRLLAELGMGQAPPRLCERALQRGAETNGLGRLAFPVALVEDIIAGAATSFVFHGRDPRHDFEIGGERVHFGTGGAAVQTLDLDSGRYRPSTLADLYDFARLADTLANVSWFTRCCVATDVPDSFDLDVNTAYALLRGTTKPVGTAFTLGAHVDPIVDMFDAVLGGEGRFAVRPFCKAHISPVVSPMRYGEDAVDVTLACIRRGVPINAIIAAQSGATAPAAPAGFLAQSLAETLAGLVLVNLFQPGYPVIFSNWPLVIDLRSGAFCGGGGESSVMNAAAAQLSNWLGLPSGVACSMADAKAVDAQMGAEKALSAALTGLAGANMVYESSGMMASLLGASFEAFVLDDEMLSHVQRAIRGIEVSDETLGFEAIREAVLGASFEAFVLDDEMLSHVQRAIRGIEVTDETLAFEAIREAVLGEGHFLGSPHTMAAMQRDYFYPRLADRDPPVTWAEKGAPDVWARARARVRDVLDRHHPAYVDPGTDARLRERFNILLPARAAEQV